MPPSLLQELPFDAFLGLPPAERADAARRAAPDLNAFLDEGRALARREAPPRTRELALGLLAALRAAGEHDEAAARALEQRIVTDAFLRSECDRDQNVYLGRLFTRVLTHAVPDLVLQPVNASEVATALRWARGAGVPVTLRGAASTAMGGAVPADAGLVLDLSRLDAIELDQAARTVRIGAGVRMRPLHARLARLGLALPVYPSNLGGTFAGWLSTGGIGMNAYGRGRALDAVRSARVVLPDATSVVVERASRTPLALGDLAGSEGQLGVLVSLELVLEPLPDIAAFLLAFDALEHALAAVEWLGREVRSGMEAPADVKLLSGSHLEHVERVWREEDAKSWRAHPSTLSDDTQLPWRRLIGPSELGLVTETGSSHPAAILFVDFLSEAAGRAFVSRFGRCPGSPRVLERESVRFARERFEPQQTKRLGPGFLAAEILMPAAEVGGYLRAAEGLARGAGVELDAEVYYLADGTALAIPGYLADHRSGAFPVDLALAPALLDLAQARFRGKPYVLGRWQANHFARRFGAARAAELRAAKRALDPDRIVNRGAFFDMGLRGLAGGLVRATMTPGVRGLRWTLALAPPLARLARSALSRGRGPAHGRGLAAGESLAGLDEARRATSEALHCVNCGECNSVCPIFHESAVRLPQMLTHLGEGLHGGEALPRTGAVLLDLCMRCGNCEEVCQAGIPHLALYGALQRASDAAGARERERHVLVLERLRASPRYLGDFLGVRPGGYVQRARASLAGAVRYLLLRAEGEAGPAATCIHCGACVEVCPTGANREYAEPAGGDPRWITTETEKCIGCGTCVEVCPANLANGGRTLRVLEAPTLEWFAAVREFEASERR